ncbi:unnamed protein product [Microthlaspi erraticum]|uniref:Uncharacterized protein n=1 Tax=Microthlaspi erraticum TaxID=1685480 RepID=A0A6D2IFN1_9BRAS|nr:unnamed protein product [Microthlaspi erraticum]
MGSTSLTPRWRLMPKLSTSFGGIKNFQRRLNSLSKPRVRIQSMCVRDSPESTRRTSKTALQDDTHNPAFSAEGVHPFEDGVPLVVPELCLTHHQVCGSSLGGGPGIRRLGPKENVLEGFPNCSTLC